MSDGKKVGAGRPPGFGGYKMRADIKKRIATEQAMPLADRIARDLEMVAALGKAQSWEFAEHMGITEQTAKNRLRRLFERGLVTRHRERGQIAWTYEAKES